MRGLVQRVLGASVTVADETIGEIRGPGLLLLVGVTHTDTEAEARKLAEKVYQLRIFDGAAIAAADSGAADSGPANSGPANSGPADSGVPGRDRDGLDPTSRGTEVSAADLGLPVLVVSQFTLYGSTSKGRRPTWEAAAPGPVAEPLVNAVADRLRVLGAHVATGRFGGDMAVQLVNDGPMTLLIEI